MNMTARSSRLPLSITRYLILAALLATTQAFFTSSPALAHSPIFPEGNHDPSHAYEIGDPSKSWAIYTSLDHPDKADYYRFTVSKGEKIEIGLMTSESPSLSGFLPSFALMVPDSDEKNSLPSYVEVPVGYGTIVANGHDPGKASYEPFSPGWLYDLADLTVNAPTSGVYYIAVYEKTQKTGDYGLPVGYVESFTLAEWLTIPYSVHTTYVWEGQSLIVTYLPLILVLAVGGLIFYRRSRQGKAPDTLSKWLAAAAGLTFLGTALGILHQMILAMTVVGFESQVIFTLIFVAIGAALGMLTLNYAAREETKPTLGRRVGLAVIGVAALVGWAGLIVGSALVILAAILPSYNRTTSAVEK
jgi:hypothetical protein